MSKGNDLRMSFAEWLFRMSAANAPYQARALAVYAVAFKVTANDELAKLSGMDTKGLADKTYNKWKSYLSTHGWVIVKQVTVGRTRTIEVEPALDGTPVTFTDLVRRMPRKFYGNTSVESTVTAEVEITGEEIAKPVKVTDEQPQTVEITVEPVEVTGEPPSCARTRIETPSGLLFPEEEDKNKQIPNSPEKPKRATPRPKATMAQFDRFWEAYPKREGKQKALQRFMDLTLEDAEKAISAAKQFADKCRRENTEGRYIKWPEGWLNAKRFLDYEAPQGANGHPPANWWRSNPEAARKLASETFWREAIKCANGHWPVEYLGPPPGDPACLLPPNLNAEMAKLYDKTGAKRS
jgi:hypothetical protein